MIVLKKISSFLYYIYRYPVYKLLFKKMGAKTRILSPLKIEGYKRISIGRNVTIGYKSWLAALPLTNREGTELIIHDGCRIGNFAHIYATSSIIIEKNVLIADKVFISDNTHSYGNIDIPIWQQPIKQLKSVTIGENSWIGENSCINGAKIGKHCVIGANSFISKDIPDYCIVAGSPGKIIKRFCRDTSAWRKVDKSGNFVT